MKKFTDNNRLERRKKEINSAFNLFKQNGGGTVTFHFSKEITVKKGNTKRVPSHKQVINLPITAANNKSVVQFVKHLQDIQHDLGADYFTI